MRPYPVPVLARHRWLYPIDWRELSTSIRFRRARGRLHGRMVLHVGDGRWWDTERQSWRDGAGRRVHLRLLPALDKARPGFPGSPHERHGPPGRTTRVMLSMAHLDHDPFNNGPGNLAAFCQRCHIMHDKAEHLRRRRPTYLTRRALGDLFTRPYG